MKIGEKEYKPFKMKWGQYKELRRKLGEIVGKRATLLDSVSKGEVDAVVGAANLGVAVALTLEMQEAVLMWAYNLEQDKLDELSPGEISSGVAEFLEFNADEEGDKNTKKAEALLMAMCQ